MYIPNYPEDSTLRRHYESAAEFRRQARLAQPPTDSVLRRHYEQLKGAASATSGSAAPATGAAAAPQSDSTESVAGSETSGGFFGWLKRLFG